MDDIVEEFFRGCIKTLKVMKVLFESDEPLSKYVIERRAMIYNSRNLLEKLVNIGVLEAVDYGVRKYYVNRDNKFVVELKNFLEKIGYLDKR